MRLPQITTYVRGIDKFGSGAFGASRDGGKRTHKGVDIAFQVAAIAPGKVTKIGYPYDPTKHPEKAHFRYVEVTDEARRRVRYFYLDPTVSVGELIEMGEGLGFLQDLTQVYPGITPHFHFEILDELGQVIDPMTYLGDL